MANRLVSNSDIVEMLFVLPVGFHGKPFCGRINVVPQNMAPCSKRVHVMKGRGIWAKPYSVRRKRKNEHEN